MSDERTTARRVGEGDILAELEAEVAHELEEQRPPAGGPAYQVVAALVTLGVGLAGAVLAQGYGLGSLARPGPGLWPMVVSVVVVVLSLALLLVGRGLTDSERFSRASALPLVGVATFVALGLLIPTLGFEIPAFALCVVWLRFLGGESWRSTIAVSLGTVAAFYALFLYGLRIPLPHLF
ncbi:tripartite tricarboxylate transporter TctB family protein [Nocardioides xinjiangensis]|uniref:tripartite tricarboxylate transporter TctB family protein n=1 Tax=Nocardioides xinjiangensis TaxID=2817376 RepID=UPI001B30323D|nr:MULTISPECIES: tripartite tricarboxylate transporter TctB family protein [unclassified Nocardioides]